MADTDKIYDSIAAEKARAQYVKDKLAVMDSNKADKATTLAGYGITNAYTKTEVNGLVDTPHQEYVTVDAYANLPAIGSKDTIYRVSNYNGSTSQVDASVYSEYAWNGSQYIFLCVKSQIGEVFDISVYNNNAKYADLAAALNGGANIPQSLQKGGMSVKFVQSSDNKYVQYRLTADDWSTNTSNWERYNDITTSNQQDSDLDFSDERNYILMRLANGHIQVKNFDSSKDATTEERGLMSSVDKTKLNSIEEGAEVNDVITYNAEDVDLDFSDEQGNVLMSLANGHIKTKNFNSEDSGVEEYKNRMKQSKYYSGNVSTLNLLHMSDIHGDTKAADYFKSFADKCSSFIDDFVMTGDVAFYLYDSTSDTDTSAHGEAATHGYKWWTEITEMAERCLFVLGNHDCETDTSNPNGKGRDWAYETYFAPFADELSIIQPNGVDDSSSPNYHACYWHKDYSVQKIRIIGLDCMNRYDGTIDENGNPVSNSWVDNARNDQELWLIDRLAETLNSESDVYGYSVVFLCHYPLDDFSGRNEEWNETNHRFTYNQKFNGGCVINEITNSPTVFHNKRTASYTANERHHMHNRTTSRFTKGTFNYIGDIIQGWVDAGGKYVAWICGHTHVDYMWYPTAYPTLLNVVIDKAGYSRGSDIADRKNGDARYCANYYSIDTVLGLFKIVRIGLNSNKYLDNKDILCYDYINKRVLNEN